MGKYWKWGTIFLIVTMIGVCAMEMPVAANGYDWDDWNDWDNGWYRGVGGYPGITPGYTYPAAYPVAYPGFVPAYFDDD